jgi:hypothetical protein
MVRVHLLAFDWIWQGSGSSCSTVPDVGDTRTGGEPLLLLGEESHPESSRAVSGGKRPSNRAVAGKPQARQRGGWRRLALVGQTGTAASRIGIPKRQTLLATRQHPGRGELTGHRLRRSIPRLRPERVNSLPVWADRSFRHANHTAHTTTSRDRWPCCRGVARTGAAR